MLLWHNPVFFESPSCVIFCSFLVFNISRLIILRSVININSHVYIKSIIYITYDPKINSKHTPLDRLTTSKNAFETLSKPRCRYGGEAFTLLQLVRCPPKVVPFYVSIIRRGTRPGVIHFHMIEIGQGVQRSGDKLRAIVYFNSGEDHG